jgi:hypothetical protein
VRDHHRKGEKANFAPTVRRNEIAMPSKTQRAEARKNRLLGALEPASRTRIDSHLEPVTLKLGVVVCEAGGSLSMRISPKAACSRS